MPILSGRRRCATWSSAEWQVSTRHRSSTPKVPHQPHPSPKPTERHRRCCSGDPVYVEHDVTPQVVSAAALDRAVVRLPSTDPSIGGGLVASAPLGVPSGHPEGGSEGVPLPACLECVTFLPVSCTCLLSVLTNFCVFQEPFRTREAASRVPTHAHARKLCAGCCRDVCRCAARASMACSAPTAAFAAYMTTC